MGSSCERCDLPVLNVCLSFSAVRSASGAMYQTPQHIFLAAPPSNVRITDSGLTSNTVELGSTTTLRCSVSGTDPLEYQWSHNGTIIPAATSSTYTVSSALFSNAGTYTCQVSNWADESSGTYTLNVQGTYVIIHSLLSIITN